MRGMNGQKVTCLEPDKRHGFAYLEGVKQAINRGMKTYKKDESF